MMRQRMARQPHVIRGAETRLDVAGCAVGGMAQLSAVWRTPVADGGGALAGLDRRWRRWLWWWRRRWRLRRGT